MQPISIQLALCVDANGKVIGLVQPDATESVKIDRAAVTASARGCVKKSDGEILMNRIRHAMDDRGMTFDALSAKSGIGKTTLYAYFKKPGNAPLARLMRLARAVGIGEITLQTCGTYYED